MEKVYLAGLVVMVTTSVVGGVYLGRYENRLRDIDRRRVIMALACFSAGIATYANVAVIFYGMTYFGYVLFALICGVIVTVVSSAVYCSTYGGFSKSL